MITHLPSSPDIVLQDAVDWLAGHQEPTLRRSKPGSSAEFREFRRLVRLSADQIGRFEPFPMEESLSSDLQVRASPLHVIQLVSAAPSTRPFPHRRALRNIAIKLMKRLDQGVQARSVAWQLIREACVAGHLALRGRKADERRFKTISGVLAWNTTWPPPQLLEWDRVILDRVELQRWASHVVKKPLGRISRFAWSDFRAVAYEKLRNNQHWSKTSLKIEMINWCATNWTHQPASITIVQQIAKIVKDFEAVNDLPQ